MLVRKVLLVSLAACKSVLQLFPFDAVLDLVVNGGGVTRTRCIYIYNYKLIGGEILCHPEIQISEQKGRGEMLVPSKYVGWAVYCNIIMF